MQARIEEVAAVDTLTLHERHGRYPQANSVEDVRRNLAAVQQRIHRNPTERQNEKTRHKAGFSGVSEILQAFSGTLSGTTWTRIEK